MKSLLVISVALLMMASPSIAESSESAVKADDAAIVTLSGTVKSHDQSALSTPTLTFNDTQAVVINPETGAFSIDIAMGTEYELTIEHPDWIFMNPKATGTIYGNTTHQFVGFPK